MEYRKITNLSNNVPNQLSKFMTKNWVEINNDLHWVYGTGSQIELKTSMLRSNFCDYSDACILVKGTITVPNTTAVGTEPNNRNEKVIFKNYALSTDCISELSNTEMNLARIMML